jgi:hypothetical protein
MKPRIADRGRVCGPAPAVERCDLAEQVACARDLEAQGAAGCRRDRQPDLAGLY